MKRKIKNIMNIFKPYKNPYLSLHKRLIGPDDKSTRYLDYLEEVKKYNLLQAYLHPLKFLYTVPGYTKTDGINLDIVTFINHFTMHSDTSDEKLAEFKDKLLKFHSTELESIDYQNRNSCTIKYKNGRVIHFNSLSSTTSKNPLLNHLTNDLLTKNRQGKCHMRSIYLSQILTNSRSYITTGAIHNYTPRAKFLHSWLEIEKDDGSIVCLDNNWNAILSKEDYYFLQHPKIIERISKDKIKADYSKILFLNHKSSKETPYVKLYCTSPDEALEKYEELKAQEERKSQNDNNEPFYIQ